MRVEVGAFLALVVACLRGCYAEVQERTVFLTRLALRSLGTERSCVLAERRLTIVLAIEMHNSNRK